MENRVEGPAQRPLGGRKARPLRVRGFAQESEHALPSDLRKALQVDGIAEHRRVVHLEIARMNDSACRRIDRQRGRVHDAVIGFDKFDPKLPEIDGLSEFDHLALRAFQKVMLLQLVFNDPHGQPGGVDRDVHLLQDIGKRADMVLMPVRDHKALHLLNMILQIRDVRDHHVDAEHIVVGEGKAAVHHNNTVLILEGSNVHADLLQTSQRDDLQPGTAVIHLFCFLQSKLPPYFLRQSQLLRPNGKISRTLPAVFVPIPPCARIFLCPC